MRSGGGVPRSRSSTRPGTTTCEAISTEAHRHIKRLDNCGWYPFFSPFVLDALMCVCGVYVVCMLFGVPVPFPRCPCVGVRYVL